MCLNLTLLLAKLLPGSDEAPICTSMILSVSFPSWQIVMASRLEASMHCKWCSRHCRKSWVKILDSRLAPPNNCSIRYNCCVGFQSPSSSAVKCSLFCSDADVSFINSVLRCIYGSCWGGDIKMSHTSCAYSGCRDDTVMGSLPSPTQALS